MVRKREVISIEVITTGIKVQEDWKTSKKKTVLSKRATKQPCNISHLTQHMATWLLSNLNQVPSFVRNFLTLSYRSSIQLTVALWGDEVGKIRALTPQFFLTPWTLFWGTYKLLRSSLTTSSIPLSLGSWVRMDAERWSQNVGDWSRFEDEGKMILAFFLPH